MQLEFGCNIPSERLALLSYLPALPFKRQLSLVSSLSLCEACFFIFLRQVSFLNFAIEPLISSNVPFSCNPSSYPPAPLHE